MKDNIEEINIFNKMLNNERNLKTRDRIRGIIH